MEGGATPSPLFPPRCRNSHIYEGTNGIQGNDLVFRKLARDSGAAFNELVTEIGSFLNEFPKDASGDFKTMHSFLTNALTSLKESAAWILDNIKTNPALAAASASPFLRLCGNVLGGYYLIRSATLAQQDLAQKKGDANFMTSKIMTARFYAAHVLPQCAALAITVCEGGLPTLEGLESLS